MFGIFRFSLSLSVMAFHLLALPAIGILAVESIFIISGFLMTLIMHKSYDYTVRGQMSFFKNRVLRLYPTYWLFLILAMVVIFLVGEEFSSQYNPKMYFPDTLGEILSNLTLVYPSFHPSSIEPRLLPPSWAITITLFFYVTIAAGISKSKLSTHIWFAASVLLYLSTGKLGVGHGSFLTASLAFSLGAMIYHHQAFLAKFLTLLPKVNIVIIFLYVLNILLAPLCQYFFPDIYMQLSWKLLVVTSWLNLPLSILLISVLFAWKPRNLRLKRLDKVLGSYSYPVYLFHTTAGCFTYWLFLKNDTDSTKTDLSVFFVALVATIALAYICEKTVTKAIDRRAEKNKIMLKALAN